MVPCHNLNQCWFTSNKVFSYGIHSTVMFTWMFNISIPMLCLKFTHHSHLSQGTMSYVESCFNSLWPSDAMYSQRAGSTFVLVMACCLSNYHYSEIWCLLRTNIIINFSDASRFVASKTDYNIVYYNAVYLSTPIYGVSGTLLQTPQPMTMGVLERQCPSIRGTKWYNSRSWFKHPNHYLRAEYRYRFGKVDNAKLKSWLRPAWSHVNSKSNHSAYWN